jgi:hypothetical protein
MNARLTTPWHMKAIAEQSGNSLGIGKPLSVWVLQGKK